MLIEFKSEEVIINMKSYILYIHYKIDVVVHICCKYKSTISFISLVLDYSRIISDYGVYGLYKKE